MAGGHLLEAESFRRNPSLCGGFLAVWHMIAQACPVRFPPEVMNQPSPQATLALSSGKWYFKTATRARGKSFFDRLNFLFFML